MSCVGFLEYTCETLLPVCMPLSPTYAKLITFTNCGKFFAIFALLAYYCKLFIKYF